MKLTLTKEFGEFVIRKDDELITTLVGYNEDEAIKRFDKCVIANSIENKPILIKEVII